MAGSDRRIIIDLRVRENGSAEAQRIMARLQRQLDQLNRLNARPTVNIIDRITRPTEQILNRLRTITRRAWIVTINARDNATRVVDGIGSKMNRMGLGTTLGAAAIIGGPAFLAGTSLKKSMDFESQMSAIKSLLNTDERAGMGDIEQLALTEGMRTKFSALEAAQGMEALIKAGMKVKDVLNGGLGAALDLASAGTLELSDAAEIMSSAMNTFKADAMTAAQAANYLAGTANASATTVGKLKFSLQMAGGPASLVGMSFKEAVAAMGIFANNGVDGSDAGTSLKTMLMNLVPQTTSDHKWFEKLNLMQNGHSAFFNDDGNIKKLADIAQLLQDRLSKLNKEKQLEALSKLFGSDAIRAGGFLMREGAKGVKAFMDEMDQVTALSVARDKMDNAAGAVEQLSGAIETMQIVALKPTLPLIKSFALSMANFVGKHQDEIKTKMEEMVDSSKNYLKTHFIDNQEFRSLDVKGKIGFIFNDIMADFQKWLDGGGNAKIQAVSDSVAKHLVDSLQAMLPKILPIAVQIGTAIIQGVGRGIADGIRDIPILGGLIKGDEKMQEYSDAMTNMFSGGGVDGKGNNYLDWFIQNWKSRFGKEEPFIGPPIPAHAMGGIMTRPHIGLVAEAGPEAIIPLSGNRNRAIELHRQAGEALGVGGGGGGGLQVNAAVSINWTEDRDALAMHIGHQIVDQVMQAMENRG